MVPTAVALSVDCGWTCAFLNDGPAVLLPGTVGPFDMFEDSGWMFNSERQSASTIASRAIQGSFWSVGASLVTIASGFLRSVLLARLLLPRHFGAVALALVFADLANVAVSFGFNAALIQYEDDSEEAASTHFVIKIGLGLCLLLLAIALTPVLNHFYADQPDVAPVLVAIVAIRLLGSANSTPETLLQRRMEFRRLVLLNVASSLAMTIVAPLLALSGWGLWSLVVGEQGVSVLVSALGLWTVRRVWRVRVQFNWRIAKHYFRFGFFMMLTQQLGYWLDQFDDFWVGTTLGDAALGFYSKAYEFARYPRRTVAQPLQDVAFATFARLQHDRERLSKAYYRVSSLVVRVGFVFSLALVLVAQEAVTVLLGDRWLPMVLTFQLMIVYTLFDPLVVTSGRLVVALGYPQVMTRIKALQLAIFVPLVLVLARYFGIEGVAVAADVMLLGGVVLTLRAVRRFVAFSLRRMFGVPLLALVLAALAALGVPRLWSPDADWLGLVSKGGIAVAVYLIVSLAFERREYEEAIWYLWQHLRGSELPGRRPQQIHPGGK
jgi:O-antigen/teichoic acid export membrane protein